MHFGIFMEFESRQGRNQAESFREGFELVEAADAWGLDGVVCELDSGGQIPRSR